MHSSFQSSNFPYTEGISNNMITTMKFVSIFEVNKSLFLSQTPQDSLTECSRDSNGILTLERKPSRRLQRYNTDLPNVTHCSETLYGTVLSSANSSSAEPGQGRINSLEMDRSASLSSLTRAHTNIPSTPGGGRRGPTGNSMATTASLLSVVVVALIATTSTAMVSRCNYRQQLLDKEDVVSVVIRLPLTLTPGW